MATQKVSKKKNLAKKDYTYAVGRRKSATARVRLYKKKGDLLVNGMAAGKYFSSKLDVASYLTPFALTNTTDKFSFSAKIEGSGKMSQLGALVHGLSRALALVDVVEYRPVLKSHGLLTRDDRMKESRKIGTGGKARRKKQSPKR